MSVSVSVCIILKWLVKEHVLRRECKSFAPHDIDFLFWRRASFHTKRYACWVNDCFICLFVWLVYYFFSPENLFELKGWINHVQKVCVWLFAATMISFFSLVGSLIQSNFHENAHHPIQNRFRKTARTWNRIMRMWNVLNFGIKKMRNVNWL